MYHSSQPHMIRVGIDITYNEDITFLYVYIGLELVCQFTASSPGVFFVLVLTMDSHLFELFAGAVNCVIFFPQ